MGDGSRTPGVVALAVDGMEPSLVNRWIEAGELPNLRSVREDGVYGTAACSSLSSANQWTTHFTGVTPETHGVDGFLRADRKRSAGDAAPEARELINLSDVRVETYPELLAGEGVRVGLINPLPLWPPLELDGGFCVSGMLTPPRTDRWVYPEELEPVLKDLEYRIDVRYGDRPYGFVDDDLFVEVSMETLYEDVFAVLDARIAFAKWAIQNRELEYLYVLAKSIDVVQHCFWAHMEAEDPTYGDAILEAYRRIDDLVGWIREEGETNLLVFSDHGFRARLDEPSGVVHGVATAVADRISVPRPVARWYSRVRGEPTDTAEDGPDVGATTGVHGDPAAWALAGPDVSPGSERKIDFEDLTPTLLALLGRPIPEAYLGTPVGAVTREVERVDRSLSVRRNVEISAEDVVSERLHNLGYAEMVDDS